MGSGISLPEDNNEELTSEAVVGLIGHSYFDQSKWREVAGEANFITVQALRDLISQHESDNVAGGDMQSGGVQQQSTTELEGDTGTYNDSVTRGSDDDSASQTLMDESTLLPESTRDVDDFSALPSLSMSRVVMKLPEDEFVEKHRRLKILYQTVRESRVGGVIASNMKDNVVEMRELMTMYYDQIGEFFIMKNRKEKMVMFIAEYYHLLDHHPKGRDFMRFYSLESQLKIGGLHHFPDITGAKPIAIALLVSVSRCISVAD